MKNKNHQRVFRIPQPKNKRADIPVTILVMGVIAVCALALFSFLSSSFSTGQSFAGVSLMEELNAKIDAHYFYRNIGVATDKIDRVLGIEDNEIYLEDNRTSILPWKKDEFLFSVR